MVNNVTSIPYRARYNQSYNVGSAGTYYHPVARWVEDRRRRITISETYQDISHTPPYTDVIQFGQPHGLFSRNANWAESSNRGYRIPPSNAIPVVTGIGGGLPVSPFDYTGETASPINFKDGSQIDPEMWQGFLDSTQEAYTTVKNATDELKKKFREWRADERSAVYGPANYNGPKDVSVYQEPYQPPKGIFHDGVSEPVKEAEKASSYDGTKDISIRGTTDLATVLKEFKKSPATKLTLKQTALEKSLRSILSRPDTSGNAKSPATNYKGQGFTPLKSPAGGLHSRKVTQTEKNINLLLGAFKVVGVTAGAVVKVLGGFAPRFYQWLQEQPRELIDNIVSKRELVAAAVYWVRNNAGRLVRADNGAPHPPIF